MGNAVYLNVNGNKVLSTKITYNDLIWLYDNFKNTYGKLPTTNDGKAKYNMPQQRIIKRVLEDNDVTFNDFMLQFGKVNHVRTESKDYELFLERYKTICSDVGCALNTQELTNNAFGLPSANWFIKYCPEKAVKSYDDFVLWCGFKSNKLKMDDGEIAGKLIKLEEDLGRPIIRSDITLDKVGFSMIVVNRIWGGLNNAKKALGLKKTAPNQPKSFEYYNQKLLETLGEIYLDKGRKIISWADIENPKYDEFPTDHTTYTKAFKREGIDFFTYIKSLGYEMNYGNKMGNVNTFSDGERTMSIYEYDFSKFLREDLHMEYNKDYCRDVMYKTFTDIKSKIDCDYVININNKLLYIEIAGVIYNTKSNEWKNVIYKTKRENSYRDNMIFKESLLLKNNKAYLFLFPYDMLSGNYKEKLKQFIKENIN